MIDGRVTRAEREHLDRVWFEIVAARDQRKRPPVAAPGGRLWYFDPPAVPGRREPVRLRGPVSGNPVERSKKTPIALTRGAIVQERLDPFKPAEPAPDTASFRPVSLNRKLAPVVMVQTPGQPRPRPEARGPFVSSTYASIDATCPSSCAFKGAGCFASAGFTKMSGLAMDAAARGRSSTEVITEEVRLIDRAFAGAGRAGRVPQDGARGGRDLRLHVGGDIGNAQDARLLGQAAGRWRARGGGAVWSYTHRWAAVHRSAWGKDLQVFASVEHPRQIEQAALQGYPSALVVETFEQDRAYPIAERWKLIPCPAETRGATCSSCRLCLDRDVLGMRAVIGFQVHGTEAKKAVEKLTQIRRRS